MTAVVGSPLVIDLVQGEDILPPWRLAAVDRTSPSQASPSQADPFHEEASYHRRQVVHTVLAPPFLLLLALAVVLQQQ